MIGRNAQLSASSTCGLSGPQKYCIIGYLEDEQKCFTCDSRYPYNLYNNPNSHQIENIITAFEPDRKLKWWQSENGVEHVSIQLNLEALFQFSHLVLTFKTFRPAAMLVERSKDNGRTWKVFRYFAQDCKASFPSVPEGPSDNLEDVICDSRYSGTEPSTDGEVVLKALDPNFEIDDPYAPHIQELITLTNLRINFTRLLTLGDNLLGRRKRNPQDKYYYALYEMVVRGSCFCNGHASQCILVDNTRGDVFRDQGMVHGRCVCQHNTDGLNCERCRDFYNDAPWRPAEELNTHTCTKCNCNGHSEKCHFNMALYLSSGGVSGGVCDDCQNNRAGPNCEQCKPFYYQDPQQPLTDPHGCIPCDCDPEGTVNGGLCEARTDPILGTVAGHCKCKENVEGLRCDRCKSGYFGINRDNPKGCQFCRCNRLGSVLISSPCDQVTGECFCQRFTTGPLCDECLPGYWGLGNSVHICTPCDCDIGGAYNNMCSSVDGQCQCLPHIIGHRCNEPATGYFFAPLDYYLYEAEHAAPMTGGPSPLVDKKTLIFYCQYSKLSFQVKPTALPKCEHYFRQRGYDFKYKNGKFVLTRINKQNVWERRQEQQNTISLDPGSPLQLVFRERVAGRPVTWTGPGFVRVQDGAGLRFNVTKVPFSMQYFVVIHFEPESTDDWTANMKVSVISSPVDGRCPEEQTQTKTVTLSGLARIAIWDMPICLDLDGSYQIDITFKTQSNANSQSSFTLIDSMGLIPQIESLQNFCSQSDIDEYRRYQCIEIASEVGSQILPNVCERLIASMSARIHNGAVSCRCNAEGSVSPSCSKFGGQCQCKPNVIGRCCDTCAPATFGFGPYGCTGLTMSCICRCLDGYYGDPVLKEPCEPCMCPDAKGSGRYFAHSCSKDQNAIQVVCNCIEGYAGSHCDKCPSGFYGNLTQPGSQCLECPCNNNIDLRDENACDKITGQCLRCLYNTVGHNCESCRPGFYGSALSQDCKECSCDELGTDSARCVVNGVCICEQSSGQCPCLPHVIGTNCDQCDVGYWNLENGRGCQQCNCNSANSLSNQCNQNTGQCPCRPDYGGRKCDECGENFFGDPELQCISCDCNVEGTEKPVCDKFTGECNCRPGVIGAFCDKCARGYDAEFPACTPCHPCFLLWDKNITGIQNTFRRLNSSVSHCSDSNITIYDNKLQDMEIKLAELQEFLNTSVASSDEIENLEHFCEKINKEKDETDPNIIFMDWTSLLNSDIDTIRYDFNRLFEDLKDKVKALPNFDTKVLLRAYDVTRKHHTDFMFAEQKKKQATTLIDESQNTREKADSLLYKTCLQNDWESLEKKVKALTVANLNEKICGSPGDAECSKARCGGALCVSFFGYRKCGGPDCSGSLPLSQNATKTSNQVEKSINYLLNQLQYSEKEINDALQKTKETKEKAVDLKKRIESTRENFHKEKEDTIILIKKVKEFLTADRVEPDDIDKVATIVLSFKLPSSPKNLEDIIKKIQSILINCAEVEDELKNLNEQLQKANTLLEEGKNAEAKAKSVDFRKVKKALENANKIQDRVEKTLASTKPSTKAINDKIAEAEEKINHTENAFDFARVQILLEEIEALKNKTAMNRLQAKEAKAAAETAFNKATDGERQLDVVFDELNKLKEKAEDQEASNEANERIEKLKMDAENLGKTVEEKIKLLTDLENKIQDLNKKKEDKANEIANLEAIIQAIRKELLDRGRGYNTC
ncbi:LAMB4 protein, partial [Atractosteus spatula]|nr:LAMB4 protein [Atractosteus spatula]